MVWAHCAQTISYKIRSKYKTVLKSTRPYSEVFYFEVLSVYHFDKLCLVDNGNAKLVSLCKL